MSRKHGDFSVLGHRGSSAAGGIARHIDPAAPQHVLEMHQAATGW
jgi:hypothetical protein